MAKLRRWSAYRRIERPYTRVSKYREKSYIRMSPQIKVVMFDMGNPRKEYECAVTLHSNEWIQIRDNALESGRETANRLLEKSVGVNNYHMKVNVYPFHILRENPLATGAGADRFSTGMQKAFGKPIGTAARIKEGQILFTVSVDKMHLDVARKALHRAGTKMPCTCRVKVIEKKFEKPVEIKAAD